MEKGMLTWEAHLPARARKLVVKEQTMHLAG